MNRKRKILIIAIIFEVVMIASTLVIFKPYFKLELNGNKEIEINIGEKYKDLGAKASYFHEDITSEIEMETNLNIDTIGTYQINYKITKNNTTKEVTRIVKVVDKVAPIITLKGSKDITLCGKEYVEDGFEATDNIDGNITGKVKVTKETDKIIYEVSDNSGNKTEIIRNLLLHDTIPPVLTLKNSDNLTYKIGSNYEEFGAVAIDNCNGDVSANIEVVKNFDTSTKGIFQVIYKAKDDSGNVGTITRNVKIYDDEDMNAGYKDIISGPTYIKNILIVNKQYSIPSNFKADTTDAIIALKEMQNAAAKEGINLPVTSGYRSYNTQKSLYDRRYASSPTYADSSTARPGHSEHQTGLAFDMVSCTQAFANTKAGKWLNDHCAEYGFIIRYPKYKEAITGYQYEPWHIRYVGTLAAKEIMDKNITLEEYLGIA